jgi:hypothetical protein
MKKIIIFLLLLCLAIHASFGQRRDISGIYGRLGEYIKIEEDRFYLIIPQSQFGHILWFTDTLAIGTFEWVDDNLIEINSTPPHNIVRQKGLNVVQSWDSTVTDNIKVLFSIPYRRSLEISVIADDFKAFELTYSKNNRDVMLPNNTEMITFSIVPKHVRSHTNDGLFYGIVEFNSFQEIQIRENVNHILIEIPAMNDSFFERYYIKGDYARISDDTIIWKGEVFRRERRNGRR